MSEKKYLSKSELKKIIEAKLSNLKSFGVHATAIKKYRERYFSSVSGKQFVKLTNLMDELKVINKNVNKKPDIEKAYAEWKVESQFEKYINKEEKFKIGISTFEKKIVDTFIINVEPTLHNPDDYAQIFNSKVVPLLKLLNKKYNGNGKVQIDMIGFWTIDNVKQDTQNCKSIEATDTDNIEFMIEQFMSGGALSKSPSSNAYFTLTSIKIKFIKPIVGGCSDKKHKNHGGCNNKIGDITLFNPYSENNNCFFKCIEEYLPEKPTKNECNRIREEFNIKLNEMVSMEEGYKIFKKYATDKKISFITNDLEILYGDEGDVDITIFYLNNHYQVLKTIKKACEACGKFYIKTHKCSEKGIKYYDNIICMKAGKTREVLVPIEKIDKGLLNKKMLHYDIETHVNPINNQHIPYIVGYCYYIGDNLIYDTIEGKDCMKTFYEFIITLEHVKYINAYNGSGFDHYYLLREQIKSDDKVGNFILNNGNILTATIKGDKKLIDLCRHLTGKLSDNLKSNGCSIAKGEINHNESVAWEITDENRKSLVREYLRCDVMGLCELYEKVNSPMYDKYNINLCEKLTTSSNAFGIWKDNYLKHEIYLLKNQDDVNVRCAIYGARCYKNKNRFTSKQYDDVMKLLDADSLNKNEFDNICDFIFDADVVSLYPTAMAEYKYPVGIEIKTNTYQKDKLGIYRIEYKAPKNLLNPILPRRENGKLVWDLNDSEGWYSSVDIENAKKKGYIIKVITGYYWQFSEYVFKEYIEEFYKMKSNATKGTPAYTLAKLYLNGLYGKMLQRPITEKDIIVKTSEEFWKILNKNIITEMHEICDNRWMIKYISKEERIKASDAQKPTQLGVFILAYSRQIMNKYYDDCGNSLSRLPYYYDTDSLNIHSSCLDKIKINTNLGGIDDDVGGKIIKGIWIAPKFYAFQYVCKKTYKLKYHFRGKGLQTDKLTWEAFEKMDRGESMSYTRDFQIKKIKFSKNSKQQDLDILSHKHIYEEDTLKTVNENKWSGRNFINDNDSIPYAFDKKYLVL